EVNKYEYDRDLHVFRLDRPLYTSVHYPGEYGFVPSTLGSDGDALDILVLAGQPSFPGCLIEVRPVGLLNMLDQGVPDAKILAVIAHNPQHQRIRDHADVEPHVLREIEHFFSVYKELEGKRTEILDWRNADEAHTLIGETHRNFRAQAR
ncbi:MAG: Inorganic diphosphatase, partial [Pedosphaera sp.]|nr:Inorganic diphosphatase [Pedosphaera sp.]